ncbi:hypothetical protein FPV67DRAFT_1725525, partial [Lyophyllum atratum]
SSGGLSVRSKFAVELFTLGLCTKYEPTAIASHLTAAKSSLAEAVGELRQFSPLLSDEEFNLHVGKCSGLVQAVVKQMQEQAAKKPSLVGMKKFNAMMAMAREYEMECLKAATAVTQGSSRAQRRMMDEKRLTGQTTFPSRDDLVARIHRLEALAGKLHAAPGVPITSPKDDPDFSLDTIMPFTDEPDPEKSLVDVSKELDFDNVDPKIRPLVEKLHVLFRDAEEYRRLVGQKKSAQRLLDSEIYL